MSSSRLLAILLTLQARGRVTAQSLADEFEVSVRTIYRDIDRLSAAGVPIYAESGPNGGLELLEGYQTRLTGLSQDEAATLVLAGMPGPARALGLGEAHSRAQLKLTAALPDMARRSASRVASRLHIDPAAWFADTETPRFLSLIADAVWSERRIAMRYERPWGQIVSRTVEPLGLVLKAGVWYVAAQVRSDVRSYRVASVLDARSLESFIRPRRFDLQSFWSEAARKYEEGLLRGTATLRVSPVGMVRLGALGASVARAGIITARDASPAGWKIVTIPVESPTNATVDILRLGAEAEVLDPPYLRDRVAAELRAIAHHYSGRRRSGGPKARKR